jgi:hypothetical protein
MFVMDQGGVFAADANALQNELNKGTAIAPGQGYLVHHSTLAAGQRDEDEDGPRLQVAAGGEIRVDVRSEQRWKQDEHGRPVQDEDGNYVLDTPVAQQTVRSISDASGHFEPGTDQTLQFVESLQDQGVNLDNTKINLVEKPDYDERGAVPAIDVYSSEFQAAEGDQGTLTDKRAVMEELKDDFAGTVRGSFDREAGQSYLGGLADAEEEAKQRARRFGGAGPDEDEELKPAAQLEGSAYVPIMDPANRGYSPILEPPIAQGEATAAPTSTGADDAARGYIPSAPIDPAALDAARGYVTRLPGEGGDGAEDQTEGQVPAAQATPPPSPGAPGSGPSQSASAYSTIGSNPATPPPSPGVPSSGQGSGGSRQAQNPSAYSTIGRN